MGRELVVIQTVEVDRATVERLRDELECAVQAFWDHPPAPNGGPPELMVDLRPVRFLDSSGIRELVQADAAMRSAGGRLRVLVEPGIVRRTLEVSGVWDHLGADATNGTA